MDVDALPPVASQRRRPSAALYTAIHYEILVAALTP
jgi:hypothetical protein